MEEIILSTKQKQSMDMESRLVFARVGMEGGLELVDADR